MRVEIRRLQQKLGITTLFVTHDQEECFSISDKVAVMNKGVVEQYDTPENIYSYPKTEFVAKFVGFENFIKLKNCGQDIFEAPDGSLFKVDNVSDAYSGELKGTIRPEDIEIYNSENNISENMLEGIVEIRTFLGKGYQYSIETKLGSIIVNSSKEHIYNQGLKVKLHLPSHKIILVKDSKEE